MSITQYLVNWPIKTTQIIFYKHKVDRTRAEKKHTQNDVVDVIIYR